MPAIQANAWLLHDSGKAKVSPDTVGIAQALNADAAERPAQTAADEPAPGVAARRPRRRRWCWIVLGVADRHRLAAHGPAGEAGHQPATPCRAWCRACSARRSCSSALADRAARACARGALTRRAAARAPRPTATLRRMATDAGAVPRLRRRPGRPRPALLAGGRRSSSPASSSCCSCASGTRAGPARAAAWPVALAVGARCRRHRHARVPGRLPGAPALSHRMFEGLVRPRPLAGQLPALLVHRLRRWRRRWSAS